MHNNELFHYGVKGMRWGVIRSRYKPHPRKRKALDKASSKTHTKGKSEDDKQHRGLSDKQKKAIKIGAAVAVTALAAYGTYRLAKSGKLNKYIDKGKARVNKLFSKQVKVGNADFGEQKVKSILRQNGLKQSTVQPTGVFKRLAKMETLEETTRLTNPNRGDPTYKNNCTACAVTAFLRTQGFDVTAKSTGGEGHNLAGVVDECFKGAKVLDGHAGKFGRSQKDAAEMLVRRFGSNASGVVGIKWKGRSIGHAFNWKIENGVASFFDGQASRSGARMSTYWRRIDPNGTLCLARLDDAEPNFEALKKYAE